MQLKIRETDEKLFIYKHKFIKLKEENKLYSTKFIADKIIEIINGEIKIKDPIVYIRDLLK